MSQHDTLTQALRALLDRYTMLVNSGDAGNWDPESEPEVIAARSALSATQPAQAAPLSPEVDEDCRQTVIWALGSAKAWTRDYAESYVTAWLTGRPAQAAQSDAVHVCPSKDIVCGDKPANWCATCPKRTAQAAQSEPPSGAFLSWAGFNLQGDEKSIKEATRLLHEAGKVPVLMQRVRDMQTAPVVLEWPALPELPVHARLYYTGSPLRRYKRASVHSGPGEPMVIVSTALEFMKRRDAQIRALLAGQPQQAAQGAGEVVADLTRLASVCPELNLNNYGPDDVDELNAWAIEVAQAIDQLADTAQPSPVVPEHSREVFERWAPPTLSRRTFKDEDGDEQYEDDWMQGAWVAYNQLAATPTPPAQAAQQGEQV